MSRLPAHLLVQRVLGQGGTSIVYEAMHERLKVPVAVKVLACSSQEWEEAEKRLVREAELYARLCIPHVPRVYDLAKLPDGTPYVVMERVSGRTLAEHLAAGALAIADALAITREVLTALVAIHGAGIVHRDIKPSNLLVECLGPAPIVHIVDFGIAKSIMGRAEPLTMQGAMVGTPHYMANEQIAGHSHDPDPRSDLYALGVVLYEMISGKLPFDGNTVGEVFASTLHDRPASLRTFRNDVSPSLQHLVDRALTRDLNKRFASAREMLSAVERELREQTIRVFVHPRQGGRRWLSLAAAGFITALLPARASEPHAVANQRNTSVGSDKERNEGRAHAALALSDSSSGRLSALGGPLSTFLVAPPQDATCSKAASAKLGEGGTPSSEAAGIGTGLAVAPVARARSSDMTLAEASAAPLPEEPTELSEPSATTTEIQIAHSGDSGSPEAGRQSFVEELGHLPDIPFSIPPNPYE